MAIIIIVVTIIIIVIIIIVGFATIIILCKKTFGLEGGRILTDFVREAFKNYLADFFR